MSLRFSMCCLPLGTALIAFCGCYSYNPYGYGYGQPGVYPQMAPGAVPQGTYQPGVGALPNSISSNPAYPAPAYDAGANWQSRGASPEPSANLGPAADQFEPPTTDNNEVPSYDDPLDPGDEAFHNSGPSSQDSSQPASPGSAENDFFGQDTFEPMGRSDAGFGEEDTFGSSEPTAAGANDLFAGNDPADDGFVEPVAVQPVSQRREIDEEELSPYAYDPDLKWLRGTVDYDRQDDAWHLIYDLTPDPNDEFGGSITLAGDEDLESLQNDDVILVQGQVDESLRDRFGKRRYRITGLWHLEPKDPSSGT